MYKNNISIQHFLIVQLIVIAVVSLLFLMTEGTHSAMSALLGGLVAFLPIAVFAKKLFSHQGARAAKQIVKSFYVGEGLKIVLTVVLFTLVFIFYRVSPKPFFLTYILIVMMHWFTPFFFNKTNEKARK